MRKLKLQMHMTLDGYVGGPNGDMDWITWGTEKVFLDYIDSLIDTSDTIVLGRKMTEGFVSYWTKTVADPKDPSYSFAKKMVDTQKVVFTKTLTRSPWANTILATGNLADEIETLRNKNGKDIIVYGGAGLVS